ncbi:hypothetical protein Daura_06240 [Dactylosporangium aurantiacum]|uniref:Uncharacterized protein n=1 Tax=Dactylosporangium aurantiacum TaxID=35754 RepID=A0A9Q9IGJ7_9ACTN|nr:conjugal transfer protein TrbL family protein [Dactylosporangium aurantiacum]MDG6108794.1 hypothetical protein [Dactylosporangium aurantiacum]UWZ55799.1 hypothetical protein Daura_06240 [Dactylosporangium aurantiacum]
MIDWLMNGLVSWLAEQLQDMLGGLLAFLTSSIFLSPDVTVLPQVTTIAGKASLVVNACYILAILAVGIATMVGGSAEMRYNIKDLVPRLVVGAVLSNFALPLCGVLIEIANSLTVSMVGTAAPTTEAVTMARTRVIAASSDASNAVLAVIIGLLIVGLMFTLVTGCIVRVGVLVILAGIGPVAMACYSLPWTQGVAQLWWRSLLGCLGTATLQAITFSTGIQLITDPNANLPTLLLLPGSDVMNLLLIAVLLWATIKIPGMMRKFAARQGQTTNVAGIILRSVLIQSVTSRLPLGRAVQGRR